MDLQQQAKELEHRCPGVRFTSITSTKIEYYEYNRKWYVDLALLDTTPEKWFQEELGKRPNIDKAKEAAYQVICPVCGPQILGYYGYIGQMKQPDKGWLCPQCGGNAQFDDDTYDAWLISLERN